MANLKIQHVLHDGGGNGLVCSVEGSDVWLRQGGDPGLSVNARAENIVWFPPSPCAPAY